MKREYQKLMAGICAPEDLRGRVLGAARETAPVEKKRWRQMRRVAVCAVCALALVLGGIRLWPETGGVSGERAESYPTPEVYWGVTAYAAERGANGGVYLPAGENPHLGELAGTVRKLDIIFADGSEISGTYCVQKENLCTTVNENGEAVRVPALAGEEKEVTAGLYAVPEESVWFLWPVSGANTVSCSAPYGLRADGVYFHSGIDIPAKTGTAITAAADGTVTDAGFTADKGNYLRIDHGDGTETVYAHCLELAVKAGDAVKAGQEIAAVGATGMATGPHLHFEVRQDGVAQNPISFFDADIRNTLKMG